MRAAGFLYILNWLIYMKLPSRSKIITFPIGFATVVLFLATVFFCSLVSAQEEQLTRDEIVAAKLDCFARAMEMPSLDWDTICAISTPEEIEATPTVEEEEYIEEVVPRKKWFVEGAELEETPAGSLTGNDPLRKIDISTNFTIYKEDREAVNSPGATGYNLQGPYYGVRGIYEFRRFENEPVHSFRDLFSEKSSINMFAFEADLHAGQLTLNFPGNTRSIYVPVITAEGRVLVGYDFPLEAKKLLTLYGGLGYRFDRVDYAGREEGVPTYDYDYSFQYLPFGINLSVPLRGPWRVDLRGEYDWMFYGKFRAEKEDLGNYQNQKWDLNDGYGIKASVRLTRLNPAPPDFYIEPYLQYWHIQKSALSRQVFNDVPGIYTYIPDWNTIEYGARIGFVY